MKTTLSLIKADIGSIGGHVKPSNAVIEKVKEVISKSNLIKDYFIFFTGDDISILMSHDKGKDSDKIHELAWTAFIEGTKIAKKQGLYGAGQDLLKDSFSGNVKGMGPAVAELEFKERENEPFVLFAADKTDPGAYNLPLYLAFTDPMHCAGLMLSPKMHKGFKFTVMDVSYTEEDKLVELNTPEELYDLAALLRETDRYVVESVHSRENGEEAASVSTTRLHNIAGKYVGKDDPVMLARVQGEFPATGELISPYTYTHFVAGFMRGSHVGPLMPVRMNATVSFFDGPPIVSSIGFCVHEGKLTEPVDLFDHSFWDHIRTKASEKALHIRQQGFFGSAMLGMNELEYGGITEKLDKLHPRFKTRVKK
ncbi:fructose-1,6-bisphosphatase [Candidatus Micrarchaeota archaeon]|nr:fructose-1,6-bisphosphatase [Candidatus Micrarchaeota archaeon]